MDKDNNNNIDYMEMSVNPIIESGIKRRTDILTIIIFLCLILIPAVLFWVMPDKQVSEDENRTLQQLPVFSVENLVSGKYTGEMRKYYADQFPFRNNFVGAKAMFSYAFGINENKGAVIAKDGWLIQRFDKYSEKTIAEKSASELGGDLTFDENMKNIKNNCGYINKFAENIKELYPDIKITVAIPPRKVDVMTNKLPAFFPTERHEKYFDELDKYASQYIYVDLLRTLQFHNDKYIYYRTDHHWTTLGAYYAYEAIMIKMGNYHMKRRTMIDEIETVCDNFYGTTWAKAGAKWIEPDVIGFFRPILGIGVSDENSYITKIHGVDNSRILNGFYDFEKLETKDKYSSFLGGINAHISIYHKVPVYPREKLLFIADSFGLALAPFLAEWHDIEMIDLRFFKDNVYDFIRDNEIQNILILPCMENFSTQNNLISLTLK
jgi:hypothetical protein